ncbi:hypothetical protein [Alicyclobacillus acidiphilus]|uniref:hypothetical protein n=1 Tax=Alicyclobacillus acidiphilus TaxID=182455 RepID=UPI00082CCE62|nr:hypothetical protein [Alicyclobacillus acidiphilus]
MKWGTGLLRNDGMNGIGWCFDMGYQVFPLFTGMTIGVRVTECYERGQVLAVTDNQLTMEFGTRRKWLYTFHQNEQCSARLTAEAAEKILDEAMEAELHRPVKSVEQHGHLENNDNFYF